MILAQVRSAAMWAFSGAAITVLLLSLGSMVGVEIVCVVWGLLFPWAAAAMLRVLPLPVLDPTADGPSQSEVLLFIIGSALVAAVQVLAYYLYLRRQCRLSERGFGIAVVAAAHLVGVVAAVAALLMAD